MQKRLTKQAAYDYLSTLKRLINLTQEQEYPLWLFLSMTPDAYRTTRDLEPALVERFAEGDGVLRVGHLQQDDALTLVRSRLRAARSACSTTSAPSSRTENGRILFPFPDDLPFSPTTCSNPRRLVKACSSAISGARDDTPLPFPAAYLQNIEARLFPNETTPTSDDPRP